jgi:HPr kinase/phosphorylase
MSDTGKKSATAVPRACRTFNIHATCIMLGKAGEAFGAPHDCGVLLLGKSGAGKSDLALRLIAAGAKLVADDRTELFVSRGILHARPPARIAGLLEAREVGIVRLPFVKRARIALVVRLEAGPRLPALKRYKPPRGLTLAAENLPPMVKIAPFQASATAKIALAAAASERGLHDGGVDTI